MPRRDDRTGDRIAKLLARAGVASRREVERMIEEGRVAIDGVAVTTPATILSTLRGVTVDGKPIEAPEHARLFLYYKPPGLLVTERDPRGRPTIYDRLPAGLPRLVPVGRLDLGTEGLLLLTNDGGLKRQLELPATGVERTYRARAYGQVTQAMLEDLAEGVEIEGVRYGSIDANIERRTGANVWIELTLTEGKNREVRRVLEHLGLEVNRLIRTRYGPFVLGELATGDVGEVKQHTLVAYRKTLKGGAPQPLPLEVEPPRPGFRSPPRADAPARSERSRPERPRPEKTPRPARAKPPKAAEAGPNRAARRAALAEAGALPRRPDTARPARPAGKTASGKPASGRAAPGRTATDRPAPGDKPKRPPRAPGPRGGKR